MSDEWQDDEHLTPEELRELEQRARARFADPVYLAQLAQLAEVDRLNAAITETLE